MDGKETLWIERNTLCIKMPILNGVKEDTNGEWNILPPQRGIAN